VAYTAGVVIIGLNWPTVIPGVVTPHELWHVAVIVGLSMHWKFTFQFAGGLPDFESRPQASRVQAD
jgi:predicted membrane channel-forming protein YqfA (hemolysin III family)